MLYVRPTPDMIIKPRHSFVDASGFVRSSYVVNWNTRCAALPAAFSATSANLRTAAFQHSTTGFCAVGREHDTPLCWNPVHNMSMAHAERPQMPR